LPTGAPQGLAVDGNGNLWVASGNANVVEFTRAQITAGDTLAPATSVLIEPSDPFGLAFDASGNLWVADHGSTFIYELTPSQLVTTGIPVTPAVTILYPGAAQFSKLAFDPTGNLWAVTHDSLLVAFTPAQLASGGTITPSVVIHSNAGSLDHPYDVAFDASGDAWVVNIADSTIVEYTPSQLAASGSPAPATTIAIRDVGTVSSAPSALAFDNSGDLWVADLNRNEVMEFTPSQLAAGGAQVPAARLTGSAFNGATGLTFDPHSPSLPLH
jgi:sugar lactone lactonase YvrE